MSPAEVGNIGGIPPDPSATDISASGPPSTISDLEAAKHEPYDEATALSTTSTGTYPEGGRAAWSVVLGSFAGLLAALGTMNTIGIYQAYLAANQLRDYTEASIGWIFGLYAFLSFFGGVQVGPIFDLKGPRLLVLAGSILILLSQFLMGVCTEYWHFMLVIGFLGGLGTSLVFTPSISAIGHWFLVRRGYATGLAIGAGGIGGVIFPLALQRMFVTLGFAWATRIIGFVQLALLIVANIFIRSRLPPKAGGSILPDPRVFRSLAFSITTAGVFFQEWALFTPIAYLPNFGIFSGAMTTAFAYQLMAIFNAFSVLGRALPGLVADRLGRYNTMFFALVVCASSALALWLPASVLVAVDPAGYRVAVKALSIAFAAVMGFGSGSNLSLTPVCVGQLCSTSEYGRYYASCYTLVSIATLTGIPIGGALLNACGGQYWGLVLFTGLSYTMSLVAFSAARVVKVGWRLDAKF